MENKETKYGFDLDVSSSVIKKMAFEKWVLNELRNKGMHVVYGSYTTKLHHLVQFVIKCRGGLTQSIFFWFSELLKVQPTPFFSNVPVAIWTLFQAIQRNDGT